MCHYYLEGTADKVTVALTLRELKNALMCTNDENWIAIRKLDCNQNWQHISSPSQYMCVGVYLVTDNLSERFWNLMFPL